MLNKLWLVKCCANYSWLFSTDLRQTSKCDIVKGSHFLFQDEYYHTLKYCTFVTSPLEVTKAINTFSWPVSDSASTIKTCLSSHPKMKTTVTNIYHTITESMKVVIFQ